MEHIFSGRKLVVATRTGKDQILKELLKQALHVDIEACSYLIGNSYDSASEVSPTLIELARLKCLDVYQRSGETLTLASVGCFGSLPSMSYVPANKEMLLIKDFMSGSEYKACVLSMETNFASNVYFDVKDALYFATQCGFPSHGLIIRKQKGDVSEIHSGVTNWRQLKDSLSHFQTKYGKIYMETDMTVTRNPSRAKVILEAGQKLIDSLYQCSPSYSSSFTEKDHFRKMKKTYCLAS